MKRKQITEFLQALFEEKKKEMKKEKKKPYVEDADSDDGDDKDDDKKKMRQDKGAYKSLASTGVKDSTVAEEVNEEIELLDESIKSRIADFLNDKFVHDDIVKTALKSFDKTLNQLMQKIPREKRSLVEPIFARVRQNLSKAKNLTEFEKITKIEVKKLKSEMNKVLQEEVIEEAIDPKIQKEISSMQKKGKNEIEILMAIDKKYGSKLSKKELEKIAAQLSDD